MGKFYPSLLIIISAIFISCASSADTVKTNTSGLSKENTVPQLPAESTADIETAVSGPVNNNELNETPAVENEQNITPVLIENKYQVEFEQKALEFYKRYSNAKNELSKSNIYNEANEWYRKFAKKINYTAINWRGVLSSLSTDKGASYIDVKIISAKNEDFKIEYTTRKLLERVCPIRKGTRLYSELSKLTALSVGDTIYFSFNFIPDKGKGILEASMTELGSMSIPEFIVNFTQISLENNSSQK